MRSVLKIASTFLFALSLALGTVGFAAGRAEAAAVKLYFCPTGINIVTGLPTCPGGACGFLGLSNCAWHNVFVNNVYQFTYCGC